MYQVPRLVSNQRKFGVGWDVGAPNGRMLTVSSEVWRETNSGRLYVEFMPEPNNWVDLWEGACPAGTVGNRSEDPCMEWFEKYATAANGTVGGFSQQPTATGP